jgi:predicted Fe-Mo cluster-binding NifX family protein
MMKIAVACQHDQIAEHFGHCQNFNIYAIEEHQIVSCESIANPEHIPGFLPNFLADLQVSVVIAGGMGKGAVDRFNAKGITAIIGASGMADDAVKAYLAGNLSANGAPCHEHQHREECRG